MRHEVGKDRGERRSRGVRRNVALAFGRDADADAVVGLVQEKDPAPQLLIILVSLAESNSIFFFKNKCTNV
jgi:hypothetical protein